jgi:TolB-like protein
MKNLIAIFVLLSSLSVYGANLIAINKLKANGIAENEALSLTNALQTEIGKTGKFQIMERAQMEEILKEQGFQQSGACDETACAVEMGKLLAVSQIVMGSVGLVGKTYTVNVRLVEVNTGEILKDFSEYHKGTIDGLLTEIIPGLARKLAGTSASPEKRHAELWVAGGIVAAAAIAIPVVILSRKSEKQPGSSDITFTWAK